MIPVIRDKLIPLSTECNISDLFENKSIKGYYDNTMLQLANKLLHDDIYM
jgi:hypothetical protein